jgi:hypothetical protein
VQQHCIGRRSIEMLGIGTRERNTWAGEIVGGDLDKDRSVQAGSKNANLIHRYVWVCD